MRGLIFDVIIINVREAGIRVNHKILIKDLR